MFALIIFDGDKYNIFEDANNRSLYTDLVSKMVRDYGFWPIRGGVVGIILLVFEMEQSFCWSLHIFVDTIDDCIDRF